jgi:aspartate/tyrosine/aromatic aminotransferase
MLADIESAPAGSVILLHACAHNPTGVDPTMEQWKKIADVCRAKKHLPFFDTAYQGFASGDLERDAVSIRYFVAQGFEMLCAQSFAKNMGTYNERAGTISFCLSSPEQVKAVNSQLKIVIRSSYSNPPAHGARVIATVLSDPQLYSEWKEELKVMSGRIIRMREVLFNALTELKTLGDWAHIKAQTVKGAEINTP